MQCKTYTKHLIQCYCVGPLDYFILCSFIFIVGLISKVLIPVAQVTLDLVNMQEDMLSRIAVGLIQHAEIDLSIGKYITNQVNKKFF